MYEILIDFENGLKRMEQAIQSFELIPNVRIEQSFLENDINYGLQNVKNTTLNLTDAANHTIQSVRDIVTLPQLHPDELIHRVRQGEKQTKQLVEQFPIDNLIFPRHNSVHISER
ncbi:MULTISPECIES: T7SS effector LXG polymorphic toxin [unclassified Oceanobacillus]|uniref:LXG domain-containing protein n=1 Tax=Oceanobacillus indicireducens TaxID=1004261 RepID=A0A918D1G9_9BACI|nr:T7SS effector LXG polymorphic toxin [Oceanobacillus sp. AG]GGN57355.1 hypothetical protein GCM10007971_18230 [Oceanobacillus indicireducens]